MNVNHIFRFLDSTVGECVGGDRLSGKVAEWEIRLSLSDSLPRPDHCLVRLEKDFSIDCLATGKQTFVDELREMSYSLARIADAAEVALRESEEAQRGGAA